MLIKEVSRISAICELDPTAGFELTEDNEIKNWNSSVRDQPTDEEIDAKLKELQTEWDAQAYARTRKPLYPDIGDQLDDLYKKGAFSDEMAAKIKKVKDDNPKPS